MSSQQSTTCVPRSLFSPAFNLASNDQWNKLDKGVPHLVVYTRSPPPSLLRIQSLQLVQIPPIEMFS